MMRRREFLAGLAGAATWPLSVGGAAGKLARIGSLVLTSADAQSLGQECSERIA